NLGAALYRQGLLEEAIVQYRCAIALAPDHVAALRLLGLVLHEARHLSEAAEIYRQAFARDPADHVVATNLGACLSDLGELGAAVAACE
ncbi:tetratricopeptide repeat protein, partial [Acinetobacter baumannii]